MQLEVKTSGRELERDARASCERRRCGGNE